MREIAIVGVGPRGGFALENLINELAEANKIKKLKITLFESTGNFGNGYIYRSNQSDANWMNLNERVLTINKRQKITSKTFEITEFPSYHDWVETKPEPSSRLENDIYPLRSQIGQYLSERFETLVNQLIEKDIVNLKIEKVTNLTLDNNNKVIIKTNKNLSYTFDEVLLTVGHQPTTLSDQIEKWEDALIDKPKLVLAKKPYPQANFLKNSKLTYNSTVAIRGMGLAMIDVVRGIANKFGRFNILDEITQRCTFSSDFDLAGMIIPFSLDGLPPVPKPINEKVDKEFEPTNEQLNAFKEVVGNSNIQKEAENTDFLIDEFASLAVEVYFKSKSKKFSEAYSKNEIQLAIKKWMKNSEYTHSLITDYTQSVTNQLIEYVDMATGQTEPSLDYFIGQVWRHCQPTIYEALSFNHCSDQVFAEIIKTDESTKRYSYGPPVESIQQLIALVRNQVLSFELAENPEITLTADGWSLKVKEKTIQANIMIDSVLDSPKIKEVSSRLISSLLDNDMLDPVHSELGIEIDENTYILPKNQETTIPVALLGRLAKGTVIGVDAILECFGNRPKLWAQQAAKNHLNWLKSK